MRKRNGFTLIELLAVIVILAVIALIATPIIMGVINDSKKGAVKDSMYSYVKAVELATTKKLTPNTDLISGEFTTVDGNLYMGSTKVLDIDMKGSKPKDREGSITVQNGQVTKAMLEFDGYSIGYDGNTSELATYKIGDVVYFDPTGAVTNCASGKEWTPTNTGTTCYKWNVIKDNGNSVEMLLDHNLGNKVAWLTREDYIAAGGTEAEYDGAYGNSKYGPITAMKQLKTDTTNWTKVETLTSTDNVTRDATSGTKYTINYNGMKARLISGQEVANIVKDTVWTPTIGDTSISAVSWLNQNLSSTNADIQHAGYWTDTASPSSNNYVWIMNYGGIMSNNYLNVPDYIGVRPVITISKSVIA